MTAHPFCTGIGPGDCRITTRYDEHDFRDAFFGILHEVGQACTNRGSIPSHYGTPMGEAVSLASTSRSRGSGRTSSAAAGRSGLLVPHGQADLPRCPPRRHADAFHAAVNRVAPSLIRVRADEVTYNLHIIVRFELERTCWRATWTSPSSPAPGTRSTANPGPDAAQRRRGLPPGHPLEPGLIGYFPTYTLGNLYAAQLFAPARRRQGELDEAFARGDRRPARRLRDRIHRHGQRIGPQT